MPSNPDKSDEVAEELVLGCYEDIAAASGQMLQAARAADWDQLVEAEMACANLILKVGALSKDAAISEAGNTRRMEIIRSVMADDAAIRNLVEPRLAKLDDYLQGCEKGRRVQNAYTH